MNACGRDCSAASSRAAACSTVSDCDGRPASPGGVSTRADSRRIQQGTADVLDGEIFARDRPDDGEQGLQRVPVDLGRLGGTSGKKTPKRRDAWSLP